MKKQGTVTFSFSLFLFILFSFQNVAASGIQGEIKSLSRKASMLLIETSGGMEVVQYGDDTEYVYIDDETGLAVGRTVLVKTENSDLVPYATRVTVDLSDKKKKEGKSGDALFPLMTIQAYADKILTKGVSHILLDIRMKDELSKGHIPGAVSIPRNIFEHTAYRFPQYLKAIIIVYGKDRNDSGTAVSARTLSSWGYQDVRILQDGMEGWRKAGLDIDPSTPGEDITYTRQYSSEETAVDVFRQYVASPDKEITILDVRSGDEREKGHFKHSLHVPLDELQYRLEELDKTKKVFTHCSSGVRARIAYYILKRSGFDVTYLNATVEFDDLGLYMINEN
jgi:rhodanese-related sulfurtransferase